MSAIEQIRKGSIGPPPATDTQPARRASVAIVLAGDPDTPSACFVERVRRAGDRWSGDVAFPGGWAKCGDENMRAAAIRETREEVGLVLGEAQHVGDMAPMPISRFDSDWGIVGASVFYVGESCPALYPDKREIARAFWIPTAHLYHPGNHTVVHWSRSGPPRPRPAIAFGQHVIWGLTYRMLVRFSNLATGGNSPLEADPD